MKLLDPKREFTVDDFTLIDDGTMDTVVRLPNDEEWRYSDTSTYRDPDSGALDFARFVKDEVIPDMDADMDMWEVS